MNYRLILEREKKKLEKKREEIHELIDIIYRMKSQKL